MLLLTINLNLKDKVTHRSFMDNKSNLKGLKGSNPGSFSTLGQFYDSGGVCTFVKGLYVKDLKVDEDQEFKLRLIKEIEKIRLYNSIRDNIRKQIVRRKGLKKSDLMQLIDKELYTAFLDEFIDIGSICDCIKCKDKVRQDSMLAKLKKNSDNLKRIVTESLSSGFSSLKLQNKEQQR